MAGSISLSLSQQFDSLGNPLSGGLLYSYAAGTTTPQSAYQDTGLVTALPNPITLDAAGRVPQLFFADGNIKIRLTDANGIVQLAADNILVIGQSSGGGGGATVDPTTLLQTGWIQPIYGTGNVTGFVRANGRTIGNASSGATERANADTVNLFTFLYADPNLAVSGGRGASAAVDYAANKTIALPDGRGMALAGLDDMGNSARGMFTSATFLSGSATVLGSFLGAARRTLALLNIPTGITSAPVSPWPIAIQSGDNIPMTSGNVSLGGSAGGGQAVPQSGAASWGNATMTTTGTATSNNTGGQAFDSVSPYLLVTIYIKL